MRARNPYILGLRFTLCLGRVSIFSRYRFHGKITFWVLGLRFVWGEFLFSADTASTTRVRTTTWSLGRQMEPGTSKWSLGRPNEAWDVQIESGTSKWSLARPNDLYILDLRFTLCLGRVSIFSRYRFHNKSKNDHVELGTSKWNLGRTNGA